MKHGLPPAAVARLSGVFAAFPEVGEAVLYGSRAKGTHKKGSDIDLALKGAELDWARLGEIETAIDDLLLPYKVDLLIYDTLEHVKLREHIDRVGVTLYRHEQSNISDSLYERSQN
ncbi:MAG: nucleotidyltransferase domain-containing protein [Planctomycetota bacterium]|nr:nucleotidyltransferase domain-containing protein [Planctomycetota bacterium]